jgi:hypothetical protein
MTPLWTADVIIIAQLGFPRERESGKEKSPDQGNWSSVAIGPAISIFAIITRCSLFLRKI